jgi:class 3 adenylate cyclase/tetratricopeptide (TPR) repeat protein
LTCPACGSAVPDGARFCPNCGRPLTPESAGGEERKLATVLFADLAGSTELAMRVDAEHLRALLADVYSELSQAAAAFGGTVEKFIGDAVMAVFGVPQSHEDDPERAVRAALTMISRLTGVGRRHGVDCDLRVGIYTGVVVAGTTPGRDFLVTGEIVNLAARLQQAAEPGEVLIGEPTFRALEPIVRTVQPRSLVVKGRGGPVVAYAVAGVAPATAYRRRRSRGPFVGRTGELSLITSLVSRAVEHRRPHLITVIGEPGIGKSRLAEEVVIELQLQPQPPVVWLGRCLPYGEGGPYAPLSDVLLRAADIAGDALRDQARRQAEGHLRALLGDGREREIADVLRTAGLSGDDDPSPSDDDFEDMGRGRDAWRLVLTALSGLQPVLVVLEDVHWAEPALLDLVESLATGDARGPLVILCMARDDLLRARPDWGSGIRNATVVTLDAIEQSEMQRLAGALPSEDDDARQAVELAGGNPFFLEELLAMAAEGGDAMPLTVQGVIAARLDLLPVEEKRLMQRAAVIGRTFGEEELAVVNPEGVHKRLIANLSRRDLLIALGSGWGFKHVLIRDVAYETMPRSERGKIHMQLARWLEGRRDAEPQTVAGHYASAVSLGTAEARPDAVRMLLRAASEARKVYAHGLALRQAGLAQSLANGERDRALAAEAVGDAYWMAEQLDDALDAYGQALEHGHRAGLGEHDMARLSWKWVDLPTRWGGLHLRAAPTREAIEAEIEDGLRNALSADASVLQARLLVAKALVVWRFEHADPPQEQALEVANQALEIAERLERSGPLVISAALDARATLLVALRRFDEASEAFERRMSLIRSIAFREEQMDICAATARHRTALGDYAGAVAAADLADELVAGGDRRWVAYPARTRVEAYFYWDRWDDALRAHDSFLEVFRQDGPGRRLNVPGLVGGVAAAVHLLRGQNERADTIERRIGRVPAQFDLIVAHALLGAGEPQLALERVASVPFSRIWVLAITAEAQAALERWDELDETLAALEALSGTDQLPRAVAQIDRARGLAGDELALARAEAGFKRLGCVFEQARCLELMGRVGEARAVYEQIGAEPALGRCAAR